MLVDWYLDKIAELVTKGLELPGIEPVAMIRLESRSEKPGLVKVEFTSVDDKVNVVRAKRKLREQASYRQVFLAGCNSNTERLLGLNMKAVLSELPNGDNYTFTGSWRLVKRDAQRPTQQKRPRASASSTSSYSGTPVKNQRRDSSTGMTGQQEHPFPVMCSSKESPNGSIQVVHNSTYDGRTDYRVGDMPASAPRSSPGTQTKVRQDRDADTDRMHNTA